MLVSLLAAFLILTFYGNIVTLVQGANPSEWWNSDWRYRIPIRIEEKSGNNLTDYQICVTIDTASLISAGKMQTNCSDIRFTDSANNELSYWIESGKNTNDTKIWIKIPKIQANKEVTIYMYYGNPLASAISNGNTTFDFFDDFSGNKLDTSKWNVSDVGAVVTVANDELHLSGDGSVEVGGIQSKLTFEPNVSVEAFIKVNHNPTWDSREYWFFSENSYYGSTRAYQTSSSGAQNDENGYLSVYSNGVGSNYDLGQIDDQDIRRSLHWTKDKVELFWNGSLKLTVTSNIPTTPMRLILLCEGQSYPDALVVPWIFVRKYISPEPTYTLGSEEKFLDFSVPWEGQTYHVTVMSNSTLEDFNFSQPEMHIRFNVSGLSGTVGYCNVTIPKSLLKGEPWTVKINGVDWSFIPSENATHSFIYFTYTHASTLQVIIQGTWAIPEFSSTMILLFLMSLTSLAIALTKKTRKIT